MADPGKYEMSFMKLYVQVSFNFLQSNTQGAKENYVLETCM